MFLNDKDTLQFSLSTLSNLGNLDVVKSYLYRGHANAAVVTLGRSGDIRYPGYIMFPTTGEDGSTEVMVAQRRINEIKQDVRQDPDGLSFLRINPVAVGLENAITLQKAE